MTNETQPPIHQKPKSLLETHQDANALIQALNEYAASQQNPSTSLNPPESSTQAQDFTPVASTSANSHPNHKTKEKASIKGSGLPVAIARRKPVFSEQPSVSKLLELGVKVRDFAYESTLPPVPTVYLQPRQIQPSVPKDVNDPNDPHYVLEEERKKKVYTFESTRKIQRTPTEPVLETELLPPPRRTFPKIKRTDALLDLGSQFDSQPQSQPMPSYPVLPYDITNTPQAASQPIPGLTSDSQQTEPWVDTPIVTPSGSRQWPEKSKATSLTPSTATTQPKVAATSASTSMASEMNSIADSDSHMPSEPETMSYSRMGFTRLDSQAPILDGSATESPMPITQSHDHQQSSQKRALTPTPVTGCVRSTPTRVGGTPLAPTSPVEPSPARDLPSFSNSASPAPLNVRSPISPTAGPSKLPSSPGHSSLSTSVSTSPRYNLRNRNKRRAESPPPPISPVRSQPTHQRNKHSRAASNPNATSHKPTSGVSVNSVHLQDKATPGVVSTGRTVKRPRESNGDTKAGESVSAIGSNVRRSKRRNKAS
ncbi:hypothetical protein D9756_000189 [Leucocoprinus leucothites]|uniref:Uncharacterized protein n=1 Tax=Leucocoprinus leucothites TaxID=201217 RepID=A0A8H5GGF1_9AGAR|nr:hypothetical protein D9756_000189 [Leucoagaricus leucothites]